MNTNLKIKISPTRTSGRLNRNSIIQKEHVRNVPALYQTSLVALSPHPSINWEQQAVAYFFHNYVLEDNYSGGGYLNFLPRLYESAPIKSHLRESTKAVSMACLANISSVHHLTLESQKSYGEALRLVRLALTNETEAKSDQVLTTLILLQKFEVGVNAICSDQF
jgi:hypothetical protein